jgi:hypothetical protein
MKEGEGDVTVSYSMIEDGALTPVMGVRRWDEGRLSERPSSCHAQTT